jgi:hypothetical protein
MRRRLLRRRGQPGLERDATRRRPELFEAAVTNETEVGEGDHLRCPLAATVDTASIEAVLAVETPCNRLRIVRGAFVYDEGTTVHRSVSQGAEQMGADKRCGAGPVAAALDCFALDDFTLQRTRSRRKPHMGDRALAMTISIDEAEGRGVSNTPFPWKICDGSSSSVYKVAGVGVDQIRLVLTVSGDVRRFCEAFTEHDYRPRGIPNTRWVGAWRIEAFKRTFLHFMGDDGPHLFYHRDSANLHVDVHFAELVSVDAAVGRAEGIVSDLARRGIESPFPARVARADFTGDVVFSSADYFRYVFSAFRSMLCDRGRVVDPFKSSTLYLSASSASRSKRLGRIYDKGRERESAVGWAIPPERYMRIEAESVWEGQRPLLADLDSEAARDVFLDRFGSVGKGTLVLKGALVKPLMDLLSSGAITSAQYEQLYTFLDHARLGLTSDLYAPDTRHRRARLARRFALEVPGLDDRAPADLDSPPDVRELIADLAAAF